jgi:hypothetical protein
MVPMVPTKNCGEFGLSKRFESPQAGDINFQNCYIPAFTIGVEFFNVYSMLSISRLGPHCDLKLWEILKVFNVEFSENILTVACSFITIDV